LAGLRSLVDELRDGAHGNGREHETQADFAICLHRMLAVIVLHDSESETHISLQAARANELIGKYDGRMDVIDDDRQRWFFWLVSHLSISADWRLRSPDARPSQRCNRLIYEL
jgi:hypothetical protein